MQVLCMVTAEQDCDVRCPCCHQRYRVYYARQDRKEQEAALFEVQLVLAGHHAESSLASAHPNDCFTVPAWDGPLHSCAAALLSGAPIGSRARAKAAPIAMVAAMQQRRVG